VFLAVLCIGLSSIPSQASDPVQVFIIEADSIAKASGDDAVTAYIIDNSILVGAVVGVVLDAAIEAGDAGNSAGEAENLAFAERVGALYRESTGSGALLDLVAIYRSWTPPQRDLRRQGKALEKQARQAEDDGKYAHAAELLEDANRIFKDIGDVRSEALVWGSLGVVHFYAGDLGAVMESYRGALAARRKIEDRILEGRTLNGIGTVNYLRENYVAAADYYRQAVALRTQTRDLGGLGTSLTYLGNTFHRMGRLVDARDSYERALDILEAEGNPNQLYENLNSIAGLYFDMGRLQSSNEAYLRALEIARSSGNVQGEIICRNNLALNLGTEYRYSEALSQLDVVESLLGQNREPLQAILFYRNRGITYLAIGDTDRARENLVAYLKEAEKQQAVTYRLEAMLHLGQLFLELGAFDRGLTYAEKVKAQAEAAGNLQVLRSAVVLAAELERLQGRYDKALDHWELALEKDRLVGAEARILQDQLGMANIHNLAGRPDEARRIYFEIRPGIEESGRSELVLVLNLGIGHSYEQTHADSAAYYYEKVLRHLEETRATLKGDDIRSGFLSGFRRHYYEEVARYYAAVAKDESGGDWSSRAFTTIERAKARGLLDLLEASMLSQESPAEAALLDSLYRLDKTSPDYDKQTEELTARYQAARDERLSTSLGGLASAGNIAGIDQVRKALPKQTVILAYALGDSVSLLWAIDRKGHELFELPNRAALRLDVQKLRDALAKPGAGDAALRRSARRLYEALVLPAQPRLAKAKRLVIVPDGELFEIPFEVLLTKEADEGAGWSELPFLARSFSPVYAPSVSIYLSLEDKKQKGKHDVDLLAVGDPDFSTLARQDRTPLEPLPFTRAEVLSISATLDDDRKDILLGEEASEARLKQQLSRSSPRLLHLATHGLIDPVEPAASSIALGTDEGSDEDGYLYTMEILALQLDVDLVVLSACESGRGRVSRSEGVVGLSRAFIASGANGIVASLWAVSDESTSLLMEEFYKKMLNKKRPAGEALNEARFTLMSNPDYAHPFYWSPFIVIGSERSPW
jgi:CHAT domain-containing protein/Tfp pilus assembly protein PilF